MHLYNFTVQPSTAITHVISGSFSEPKIQELVVAKGKILELWKQDEEGRIRSVYSTEVFGLIRSISALRTAGSQRDAIVVGSDSGRVVILEFDPILHKFIKIHQETYGKTGCRRAVPGQYLAVEPKGRAFMIGAVEKQKFVYVSARNTANQLTISSPLEAHRNNTVTYSLVPLDVGYDHPMFAAIELDHSEADISSKPDIYSFTSKMLSFYELDLGTNHVTRKFAKEIDPTSHLLITVPGGSDGPGGVIVCSENFLSYRNTTGEPIICPIPRSKKCDPNRGVMIVTYSMFKRKEFFFFLIQSELGDLYKVTMEIGSDKNVQGINVKYFDTIPVANSIVILRTGFLFVAAEFSDHKLYHFENIGDDIEDDIVGNATVTHMGQSYQTPIFNPQPLRSLAPAQELPSLAPITDFKVVDLENEGNPQFYCLCGAGARSSIKVLKHGLTVTELAESELDDTPTNVFTVKQSFNDPLDKYMIVSFANYTIVLSIGENVQQVFDSGLLGTAPTIAACNIGETSLVQVHSGGVRIVKADRSIVEWESGKKGIIRAAANETQVVVALNGGELVYFELDQMTGNLNEVLRKDMGQDAACLSIGPVPEGKVRSRFLAIGFYDKTVRVLSLEQEDCLQDLTRQALPAEPESLCITKMGLNTQSVQTDAFYLNIGLNNGIFLRSLIDSVNGELSDTRTRFLGAKGVRIVNIKVQNEAATLALSSRSWLSYNYQSKYNMTPLSTLPLDYACALSSEACPEGLVGISGRKLRVLAIERLGESFNQKTIPLKYTPRKFVIHPKSKKLIIIETDHNAYTQTQKIAMNKQNGTNMDTTDDDAKKEQPPLEELLAEDVNMPERDFGATKRGPNSGKWASYIRIFDPQSETTSEFLELGENEAAFSMALCEFASAKNEVFLIIGSAQDLTLQPSRNVKNGIISVYRFTENGSKLQLVHKTIVEDVPYALHAFQGRLLVGMKNVLRLYDMGQKKILRKCENKNFPNFITSLHVQGDRIYVGDIQESFHFVKYKQKDNLFIVFADDTHPRWLTSSTLLDYDTMAGGDKFGNIFICRLPENVSEDVDEDYSGNRWVWERGLLNGAPQKVEEIVQFHVGEVVTGLSKVSLISGAPSVLVYATLMGSIGILVPFAKKEDVDFFTILESNMREENPPLCGRDHFAFRSFYFPVKNVIDGDLCDQYSYIDATKQKSIADLVNRSPSEVVKKLEDFFPRKFVQDKPVLGDDSSKNKLFEEIDPHTLEKLKTRPNEVIYSNNLDHSFKNQPENNTSIAAWKPSSTALVKESTPLSSAPPLTEPNSAKKSQPLISKDISIGLLDKIMEEWKQEEKSLGTGSRRVRDIVTVDPLESHVQKQRQETSSSSIIEKPSSVEELYSKTLPKARSYLRQTGLKQVGFLRQNSISTEQFERNKYQSQYEKLKTTFDPFKPNHFLEDPSIHYLQPKVWIGLHPPNAEDDYIRFALETLSTHFQVTNLGDVWQYEFTFVSHIEYPIQLLLIMNIANAENRRNIAYAERIVQLDSSTASNTISNSGVSKTEYHVEGVFGVNPRQLERGTYAITANIMLLDKSSSQIQLSSHQQMVSVS